MNKNIAVFLFALCPLIPAASQFSYGIILSFSLLWLFFTGILMKKLIVKIAPANTAPYIELVGIAGFSTIFFLVLQGFYPVLAVSLGLYIYISSFSYVLLSSIASFPPQTQASLSIMPFIPILLGFSLLREILGFGTVSVPIPSGSLAFIVLPDFNSYGLGFWGTAGGALILLGIFAWFVQFLNRKKEIIQRNS